MGQEPIEKLLDLARAGDYSGAASAATSVTAKNGKINQFRARCFLSADNFTAFEHFLKNSKSRKNDLYLESAYFYYRTGKIKESMESLEKSVNSSDQEDREIAHMLLAQLSFKNEDLDTPRTLYLEACQNLKRDQDLWTNRLAVEASAVDLAVSQDASNVLVKNATKIIGNSDSADHFELLFNIVCLKSLGSISKPDNLLQAIINLRKTGSSIDEAYGLEENSLLCSVQESFILSKIGKEKEAASLCFELLSTHKSSETVPRWLILLLTSNLFALKGFGDDSCHRLSSEMFAKLSPEIDNFLSLKAAEKEKKPFHKNKLGKNVVSKLSGKAAQFFLLNYGQWQLSSLRVGPCLQTCQKLGIMYPEMKQSSNLLKIKAFGAKKKYSAAKNYAISCFAEACESKVSNEVPEKYILSALEVLSTAKKLSKSDATLLLSKMGAMKYKEGLETCLNSFSNDNESLLEYLSKGFAVLLENVKPDDAVSKENLLKLLKAYFKFLLKTENFQRGFDIFETLKASEKSKNLENIMLACNNERLIFAASCDTSKGEDFLSEAFSEFESFLLSSGGSAEALLEQVLPYNISRSSNLSKEKDADVVAKRKERKKLKNRKKKKQQYLLKLKEDGVDVVEGANKLDPERWVPKHLRKVNQHHRRRRNDKFTGGQGNVDEQASAKLDVKSKVDQVKELPKNVKGRRKGGRKGRR